METGRETRQKSMSKLELKRMYDNLIKCNGTSTLRLRSETEKRTITAVFISNYYWITKSVNNKVGGSRNSGNTWDARKLITAQMIKAERYINLPCFGMYVPTPSRPSYFSSCDQNDSGHNKTGHELLCIVTVYRCNDEAKNPVILFLVYRYFPIITCYRRPKSKWLHSLSVCLCSVKQNSLTSQYFW